MTANYVNTHFFLQERAFAEALWMCIQFAGRVLHTLMTFAKLVNINHFE